VRAYNTPRAKHRGRRKPPRTGPWRTIPPSGQVRARSPLRGHAGGGLFNQLNKFLDKSQHLCAIHKLPRACSYGSQLLVGVLGRLAAGCRNRHRASAEACWRGAPVSGTTFAPLRSGEGTDYPIPGQNPVRRQTHLLIVWLACSLVATTRTGP